MKRRKFPRPPLPPETSEADSCIVIGQEGKLVYQSPIPPGGSRFKYVKGQGLVYVGKRDASKTEPSEPAR